MYIFICVFDDYNFVSFYNYNCFSPLAWCCCCFVCNHLKSNYNFRSTISTVQQLISHTSLPKHTCIAAKVDSLKSITENRETAVLLPFINTIWPPDSDVGTVFGDWRVVVPQTINLILHTIDYKIISSQFWKHSIIFFFSVKSVSCLYLVSYVIFIFWTYS